MEPTTPKEAPRHPLDRDPEAPPREVLSQLFGRVLDPGTAMRVKGVTPRPTAYVGHRLLVPTLRVADVVPVLAEAAKFKGWELVQDETFAPWQVTLPDPDKLEGRITLGQTRFVIDILPGQASSAPLPGRDRRPGVLAPDPVRPIGPVAQPRQLALHRHPLRDGDAKLHLGQRGSLDRAVDRRAQPGQRPLCVHPIQALGVFLQIVLVGRGSVGVLRRDIGLLVHFLLEQPFGYAADHVLKAFRLHGRAQDKVRRQHHRQGQASHRVSFHPARQGPLTCR